MSRARCNFLILAFASAILILGPRPSHAFVTAPSGISAALSYTNGTECCPGHLDWIVHGLFTKSVSNGTTVAIGFLHDAYVPVMPVMSIKDEATDEPLELDLGTGTISSVAVNG